MSPDLPAPTPRPRYTLFGVLNFAGNLLTLSICLLILWLGLLTAAPGSAAALDARKRMTPDDPPVSVRALFADTGRYFRRLWMFGPLMTILGVGTWIALAFWLTIPAPAGLIMVAVTLVVGTVVSLLGLAAPTSGRRVERAGQVVRQAARIVALAPGRSILALMAAAAAVVLSVQFPAVGLVALGAALTEIAYRAWGRSDSESPTR
ncbi:hypothetical protein [Microbacterium sp. LWH3-1.2]|jgi:hypothetical protein|uniref:hypothetical protein n=1 Tax=Microbacterium sp. LWH3-1.2 TaxID=3135256 RepID=UPI0034189C37